MNSTGKVFLGIISIFLTCTSCTRMNLHQPDFPPGDWAIDLDLEFSEDLYCKIMKLKEMEFNDYSDSYRIEFDLDNEGCLKVDPEHPLVTGKILENFRKEEIPVAYLPQKDLKRSYNKAFEILTRFDFENIYRSNDPDTPGVDVGFMMSVNDRYIIISFGKFEKIESLPSEVIQLLSIFRRNLSPEYDHFFNFLKVPKLSPLSAEERSHLRECQVHKEWMKVDTVKLVVGDICCGSEEFLKAENALFPNSNFIYWGGSFGGSEKSHTITLYCQSCREAEKKWYEEQGEDFEEVLKERQEDY